MLYGGQSFGEMVLLGGATRSATVTCVDACVFLVIKERDFASLCDRNPRIGYTVMRNMASDLSYKLRSSNLLLRGNIRWQAGELGRRS
jgi:CRP-like cAMP-binding protein